ncbi:hypothetical protein [Mesonia aquimarina]|uniref:hypothetical protein n=1 Tax=Mesonia aquimarina TaxID=1504967 RepID=UPI000EF5D388|nr:hypothetical protein [Mesonia aquimarina]
MYDDIPEKIIKNNFRQITGFWLRPTKIEAIAKYHQGFSKKDIKNITTHLEEDNKSLACAIHKENEKTT